MKAALGSDRRWRKRGGGREDTDFAKKVAIGLFISRDLLYLWEISNFYHKMQEKDGKYIFGVVKVGDKGQIVIPKDARKLYNINPGDALIMLGDQKGIAMLKTEIFQDAIDQAMGGLTK